MVFGGGVWTAGLFLGVEDLEREDGEAVDHEARRFGVERGGERLVGHGFEEGDVDAFDEVVALLVEAVDVVLDGNHGFAGDVWGAGLVFGVPEIEVGTVVVEDELVEGSGGFDG